MTDQDTTPATPEAVSESTADSPTPPTALVDAGDPAGAEALGDAGKRALEAMKARVQETKREAAARIAELEAKLNGKEEEYAAAQALQRMKDEALAAATAAANERILKAEVRAAAAGKLSDPSDALRFIDTSDFTVSEDGAVDHTAITAAIDRLMAAKPYLTAQGGRKFQGSADGGARNDATPVAQLTHDQLRSMTPEQIVAAKEAGQLNDLMGIR